jgi:hypothetical protein
MNLLAPSAKPIQVGEECGGGKSVFFVRTQENIAWSDYF